MFAQFYFQLLATIVLEGRKISLSGRDQNRMSSQNIIGPITEWSVTHSLRGQGADL